MDLNPYRSSIWKGMLMALAVVILGLLAWPGEVFAAESGALREPQNGIPLVIVHVDEAAQGFGTIQEMNGSADHSIKCTGTVEIKVPDGWESPYGKGDMPAGEIKLDYIRGRGNSTWGASKKPYKIVLEEKADLFGMGAADDWALMANAGDGTLILNRITSWLGEQTGMPYTPQMVPVDLVMEGASGSKYLGSYCLSETVKVGKSRVDIDKLQTNVESTTEEENITGGYLLSLYTDEQNSDEPDSTVFSTKYGVNFINKTPSYDDTKGALTLGQELQRTYIRKTIQEIEDLIMEPEHIDQEAHDRIDQKMDLQSTADYWWIQEFSRNGDAYGTSSTYLYKERGGKVYWGPLWDFDIAWGTVMEDAPEEPVMVQGFSNTSMPWIDALRKKDPAYREILKQRWAVFDAKLEELVRDGGLIDQYGKELSLSQKQDYHQWTDGRDPDAPGYAFYQGAEDYQGKLEGLKRWIRMRREWINTKLYLLDKTEVKVSYEVDGAVTNTEVFNMEDFFETAYHPIKKGYVFNGWVDQTTGESAAGARLYDDVTFTATYIPEKEAIAPQGLFMNQKEDWISLNAGCYFVGNITIFPEDATDQHIDFSVSDESVAEFTEQDVLTLKKTGDVRVKATLYNGVNSSFLLHVCDPDEYQEHSIEGFSVKRKAMTIEEGSAEQIAYELAPKAGPYTGGYWVRFSEKNQKIAVADMNGAVCGVAPGKTTVSVELTYLGDVIFSENVDVTVTAKNRKKDPVQAKGKTVKLAEKKLASKQVAIPRKKAITISKAKGTVTYKLVHVNQKKGKFSVDEKTGKITVKQGLKQGTYRLKVKVQVSDSPKYLHTEKTVNVVIKVSS